MLMNECKVCGCILRRQPDQTALCPCCGRVYHENQNTIQKAPIIPESDTMDEARIIVATFLFVGIFFMMIARIYPVAIGLFVLCAKIISTKKEAKSVPVHETATRQIRQTEQLKTCDDYICAFYRLRLKELPLGDLGFETIQQLQQLNRKHNALCEMLTPEHPFVASTKNAEDFIFENCRHILNRMKFCDQNDAAFLQEHATYISRKLKENAKVLFDYEKLIIEVTQMDDNAPRPEPCIDVLTETLRNIRTYDGALERAPRTSYAKQDSLQQMMLQ